MFASTSLALAALAAVSVSAQGIIDNMAAFTQLTAAADTFDGDYYVKNAATGKYLFFDRNSDTTNLVTGDTPTPITLGHDSQYGQSGRKNEHWEGTFFTGLTKCMSAQWDETNGHDYAAVSYACKVGEDPTGTESLEVAKQFWRVVPCGSSSSDSASTAEFKLNAVQSEKTSKATASFSSAASSTTKSASSPAATKSSHRVDPNDRRTWVCRHTGAWLAEHPDYVYKLGKIECEERLKSYLASHPQLKMNAVASSGSKVNSHDRTTWKCGHTGKWLARHPDYVWKAGKIECRERLLEYQASHQPKRRSLPESVSSLTKRASNTYCIVAVDHLTDMATKALTPNRIDTFGGYVSLKLANYDKTAEEQQWVITEA
ncbi:hypothetical protein OF846_004547 [Rhodotorula toruloides]|nr:hypothetical protein OF846_004547 [Rhodotorula toruloides]